MTLVTILVQFLATCPLWCATFEASLGMSHAHGSHGPVHDPECPGETPGSIPAPVNDDCCVCNGALLGGDLDRITGDSHPDTPLPAFAPPITAMWLVLPVSGTRSPGGWRDGPSPPGDYCARILSILQSYRC